MSGQAGYRRDLLSYNTDSDTLLAGITVRPSKRFGFGIHFSWTESEAALDPFAIDAGDYLETHPAVVYDFSNSHSYSALDLSRRETEVHAGYSFNDEMSLKLRYIRAEYDDNDPYLYDTTGAFDHYLAALIWRF